jgi:phage gpG-like protein
MSLTIDDKAAKRTEAKLRVMAKRVQNPAPIWKVVGSYIAASNRKQFSTHGAYYGTPWRPLKPRYAQWKVRNGYGQKTLVRTGAMRASFVSRPMKIEKYYGNRAEFGSDYWLVKFHQYGTHRNGKRANPVRTMMRKTARMTSDIASIIEEYVLNGRASIRKYL